jgi:ABC-type branched-subunit amino acid transport system ATPase component/predicted MFS family arabinose efflux permease
MAEPMDPSTTNAGALAAAVMDEEGRRVEQKRLGARPTDIDDGLLAGVGAERMPVAQVLRRGGVSMVGVLTALVFLDAIDNSAFAVLGPNIQKSLHMSDLTLGLVGSLSGLTLFLGAIPLGYLADHMRRTPIVGICTLMWAGFAVCTGSAQAVWQLMLARTAAGISKANEYPVHSALLADAYPIEGRNRIYGIHQAGQPLGAVIGPVLAGGIAAIAGGNSGWRWVFVVLSVPAVALGLAALGLKEPKRGANEMQSVLGGEMDASENELPIPISAAFERLKKIKTYYYLMCALGALGLAFVSAPIYANLVLAHNYHLDAAHRGLVGTLSALGGIVGVAIGGTAGDRLFRRAPERSMLLTGALIAGFGVTFPLAMYMPNVPLYTIVSGLSLGLVLGAFVPVYALVAAVTPFRIRSIGFAMIGLYLSLIGGLGGAILLGAIAASLGDRAALAVVVPPAALIGAALIAYGSRFIRGDIAMAGAELVEEKEDRARVAAGGDQSLLQVRHLDFSYGTVQVLFDVNIDVRQGEVLALLGTNGAGKSTLLRAVSGLDVGDRGAVRLMGRTVTFADAVTRVRLGIVQVMGGKAVFPSLTVGDNLRAGAYSFISDRERVATRLEEVLELFPVLKDRIDQPAGTLSGGEQQMLGLASALLLEPKILLIDELSLGLAPLVVQHLLQIVERLKEDGLTMVIVEQSVNVALSIADRAVFMEKGHVRFQGPAAELLERDDLVRAVFLGDEGG